MFLLLSSASRSPGNASIVCVRQQITQLQAGVMTPQGQICCTPSYVLVIALGTRSFPIQGHLWASGCLI